MHLQLRSTNRILLFVFFLIFNCTSNFSEEKTKGKDTYISGGFVERQQQEFRKSTSTHYEIRQRQLAAFEKIVEVIKEVVVEKVTTDNSLKPKLDALQNTVQKLKQDNIDKDKQIREYEQTIKDIQTHQQGTKALYLRGSNLDDKLYNNK